MEKYGFVYIWRDRKHNRYYIGAHWGTEDDGYICSSPWLLKAYKRRPQDFKRKILQRIYTNRIDMFQTEQNWLNLIKENEIRVRYYNLINKVSDYWHKYEDKKLTTSEKISIKTKEAMQRPDVMANYKEGLMTRDSRSSDLEVRIKRSNSMKETMAKKFPNRKQRTKFGSEEYCSNMAEKTKQLWQKPGHKEFVGKKISQSLIGRPSPVKNTFWWNNGMINTRKNECPGPEWIKGKI
jgi:hypothetical protein